MTEAAPTIVDMETWQRERDVLLLREKAHTREGDSIAAARRRLPMVEVAPVTLEGPDGPVPLADIFDGRNQLVVYKHMWHLGKPFEDQCPGCTAALWDFHNEAYLLERGINFAVFGEGPYAELAPYREFMGYGHRWFSNYGIEDPAVGGGGEIACYLRDGDRVFLTYSTTDRGNEAIMSSHKLLDLTAYGRQETWEQSPEGWPQRPTGQAWRRDGRPVPQWTRPGITAIDGSCGTGCCQPN